MSTHAIPTDQDQSALLAPFEAWADQQTRLDELSQASVAKYRPLWLAWTGWLLDRNVRWDAAGAGDIEAFLGGPAPGRGGRRPALNPERMSSYTRQRYWRLLRGVYAVASHQGGVKESPALAVPDERRPSVGERDRQSQVLEPSVFARLRQPDTLRAILPLTSERDWWHVRDRALLAVLVETGLSAGEIIALRGMDVIDPDTRLQYRPAQGKLLAEARASLLIDVMDGATTIGRTLALEPGMAALLQDWLLQRQRLLLERAARARPLSEREQFLREHDAQGPLFVARRARQGNAVLPSLDQVTVYYAVSHALKALRHDMAEILGTDGPHVASGPAVIRNSVIRHWLDRLGVEQTVRLAGLKNAESLRLRPNKEVSAP